MTSGDSYVKYYLNTAIDSLRDEIEKLHASVKDREQRISALRQSLEAQQTRLNSAMIARDAIVLAKGPYDAG